MPVNHLEVETVTMFAHQLVTRLALGRGIWLLLPVVTQLVDRTEKEEAQTMLVSVRRLTVWERRRKEGQTAPQRLKGSGLYVDLSVDASKLKFHFHLIIYTLAVAHAISSLISNATEQVK